MPYWTRITRIFRDIPRQSIIAGCRTSNIREIVQEKMEKRGLKCRCIRCREVKQRYNAQEKISLFREDYECSNGREIFLSFENKNRSKLYSLLRLRIPWCSPAKLPENHSLAILPVLKGAALIREIQTFGLQLPIKSSRSLTDSPQHKGLGKKLIKQAEKIVHTEFSRNAKQEFGCSKIAVISGIGARAYYRKLGYRIQNTYMVKDLE